MALDFNTPDKVKIIMDEYLKNILEELPDDLKWNAPTPACNNLFQVNSRSPNCLPEEENMTFIT
jgi:hypothetical protein